MSPTVPRIGRYRLGPVIGTGAFATVYRAHDDRLDGDVAVKVLAENHALNPDLRERFVLEGQLLRRMASPHILTVHDVGENERAQPYLVLELADRGDLRSRVSAATTAGRTATLAEVGRVAGALAEAMGVLHAARVIHRDLAPGNLLLASPDASSASEVLGTGILADDERLVVGDLGLSKDLAKASGLTVGTGTAGFTPPEQRAAGAWIDPRADIWSASAVVVWLITGAPPDDEGRWSEGIAARGWPADLVAALRHGLVTDPVGRPPTAGAWHDAVITALQPTPIEAPAAARGALVTDSPSPRPRWLRRVVVAALLLVLVLGAALAGWAWRGTGHGGLTRTELSGGRARVVADDHGMRVAITGPRSAKVGDVVRFSASVDGTGSAFWVTSDGRSYPSTSQVEVVPSSPGRSVIVLIGRDGGGRVVAARFELTVER